MRLFVKTASLALAFLAASGLTVAASAHMAPQRERAMSTMTFSAVDRDGDGLIDAKEAAKVPGFNFAAADRNNNGVLSENEWVEAGGKIG